MKPSALRPIDDLVLRLGPLAPLREDLVRLSEVLASLFLSGGTLFLCGNGGSAADADHIVGELQKGFVLPRPVPVNTRAAFVGAGLPESLAIRMQQGMRAMTLSGSPALATAVLNDNDPVLVFAQPLYALARPGDAVLGITTSGQSANVLRVGRALGLGVLGLTGPARAEIDHVADFVVHAPGGTTHEVQEYHRPISHAVCMAVEEELFGG
jgi:D-sedoheptulose 7-phosphate isomerase